MGVKSKTFDALRHFGAAKAKWKGHDGFKADAVREDEAKYQQAGVSAYIINQTYLVSGAQEPEILIQAFREIAEEV